MAIIQRIRTVFTGVAGTPWYSNIYVTGNEADASLEIDAVGDFWDILAPIIVTPVVWTVEGVVANINDANGQIVSTSDNTERNGAGSQSGEALPSANQYLVRARTGVYVGGRELRGRMFIPGASEAQSSDGLPSSATLTVIEDAVDAELLGTLGLNGAWVVWSRTHGVS